MAGPVRLLASLVDKLAAGPASPQVLVGLEPSTSASSSSPLIVDVLHISVAQLDDPNGLLCKCVKSIRSSCGALQNKQLVCSGLVRC